LKPSILILDYSVNRQETAVIRSCIDKSLNVDSMFIDTKESFPDNLIEKAYTHVIHSGSVLSINETEPFTEKAIKYIRKLTTKGVWQMGICFGHQLVARALIGLDAVQASPKGFEVGWEPVHFNARGMELLGVRETEKVWQHHFDEVIELPDGSELLATNSHSQIQAYINFNKHLLGTQFHPEFNRESGNAYFMNDSLNIEKQNFKVEELIKHGPSMDTGKVFFEFFLAQKCTN